MQVIGKGFGNSNNAYRSSNNDDYENDDTNDYPKKRFNGGRGGGRGGGMYNTDFSFIFINYCFKKQMFGFLLPGLSLLAKTNHLEST